MQGYNASFARAYHLHWGNFAASAAPKIRAYYESMAVGEHSHTLLDLCCGTGELAMHFLENGYEVTGLDLSPAMLDYARASAAAYIVAGQARFVEGDASNFTFPERFGLAVSTFDALNHLPDFSALKNCFLSVFSVLETGGMLIFDLNTTEGLRRWQSISLDDSPDIMLVIRAIYDEGSRRALTRISGFLPAGSGLYERFEETVYETAFDLGEVREALLVTGFRSVRFARLQDLDTPVEAPESERRIFIIAEK